MDRALWSKVGETEALSQRYFALNLSNCAQAPNLQPSRVINANPAILKNRCRAPNTGTKTPVNP